MNMMPLVGTSKQEVPLGSVDTTEAKQRAEWPEFADLRLPNAAKLSGGQEVRNLGPALARSAPWA